MGKKVSKAGKGLLASYKSNNNFGKNKVRKLQSHLNKHPDDAVAATALATHSRSVAVSPRWGHKRVGHLNAAQRLHDQTTSIVRAGENQLKYLVKHTNVVPEGNQFTSDELKAKAESAVAA